MEQRRNRRVHWSSLVGPTISHRRAPRSSLLLDSRRHAQRARIAAGIQATMQTPPPHQSDVQKCKTATSGNVTAADRRQTGERKQWQQTVGARRPARAVTKRLGLADLEFSWRADLSGSTVCLA